MPYFCGRVVDVSEVTSSRNAVIQSIISRGHHHANSYFQLAIRDTHPLSALARVS
jgi:hypothetical protein